MTLTDALIYAGTFVGGSAVLLGALTWLLRTWFTHGLDRDLANHKAALDRVTEAESQRLRHELEIASADAVKRSTLLNEKRAEIIATLYARLLEFVEAAERYTAVGGILGGMNVDIECASMHQKSVDFSNYFRRNRIYFSQKLCNSMHELYQAVDGPASGVDWGIIEYEWPNDPSKQRDLWDKAHKAIRTNGHLLLAEIEKEFRALLGVKDVELHRQHQ